VQRKSCQGIDGGHWWQRLQKAKDKYLKLVKALNIFYPCPFALNTEG
jgi:hypothetical protein